MKQVTKAVIAAAGLARDFFHLRILSSSAVAISARLRIILMFPRRFTGELYVRGEKKRPLIDALDELSNLANFIYIRQKGPYGNATLVACAAHLIGDDEPFIYTFADDFIVASPSRFSQMVKGTKSVRAQC